MGAKVTSSKKVNGDINVTPLIDVVLVLLIIFMVLTPIVIQEMAVNLPEKTEEVPPEDIPQDQLVAAVCADGTFALNKKVMGLAELEDTVGKRLRGKEKKVVFVDAHPDADYHRVVTLMDSVRAAGATRLGIGKLKTPEDFTSCTSTVVDLGVPAVPAEAPPAGG